MIHEIRNRIDWNEFLLAQPTQAGIFLQSWQWGEFQKSVGRRVYRFANSLQPTAYSFAQVAELPLPLGKKYWYIPRGAPFKELLEEARKRGVLFVRHEPLEGDAPPDAMRTKSINPSQTLIVNLGKSEEELLAGMHEKTRYNIRLALRKGVIIKTSTLHHKRADRPFCGGTLGLGEFWKLLQETAKRAGFRTHEPEYYEKMLSVMETWKHGNMETMSTKLWIAYASTTPLAAAIVAYFGDTATYLHGASSYEHRTLMGPYALHWHIMQDAKKLGYKYYDFWGIRTRYPLPVTSYDNWSGMTRFKMGFGSNVVNYPGTFDLPINRLWYAVYRLGRFCRI